MKTDANNDLVDARTEKRRSWILPRSEATSILRITAGMPPLMSMLNNERWLCMEARLFNQKRFTRCLRQW